MNIALSRNAATNALRTNLLIHNDVPMTKPIDIANTFNKYFCSVAHRVHLPKDSPMMVPLLSVNEVSCFMVLTTSTEVLSVIQSLKPLKSCGQNGISPVFLK